MTDSLSQMVKDGPTEEAVVFSDEDLDLSAEETEKTTTQQATSEEEDEAVVPEDPNIIRITQLSSWFDMNVANFPNIRKPTVTIAGVNPEEQLLLTVPVSSDDDKRKIIIFNDANILPVLDRPAMDMQIYNNGFRIIYDLGDGIFAKSYGVRTGLVTVFCNDINDDLIPYAIVRAKKKDESIEIIRNEPDEVAAKLGNDLDFEALQLRYKQSSKAEELTTNLDAIKWLIERQATIEDINHHLQIDNVIIDTLT